MIYRYLFKELLSFFLLFLLTLFLILVISDISLHTFHLGEGREVEYGKLLLYYGALFVKHSSILLPIAILIASIKVLHSLNSQKQLLALQTSGVSSKKILSPFFCLALLSTLFNFANYEWITPKALQFADRVNVQYFKSQFYNPNSKPLRVWHLEDGSKLIFAKQEEGRFFDVFFIKDFSDIWHMKYLNCDPQNPMAYYVDHFQMGHGGELVKTDSYESHLMSGIQWQKEMPRKGITPIQIKSLSYLAHLLHDKAQKSPYHHQEILTHFVYKLLVPFLSFLVVLAIAPYVMTNSRNNKIQLIYLLSLSSLIIFFTSLDAAVILGENNVVPPLLAITIPIGALCCFIFPKYLKMR